MLCPSCQSEFSAADERCITCGYNLAGAITSGTLIGGRYEILNLLGRGGMGVVYKARDRVLDETVALKLLRADFTREQDQRHFRAEIKLARKVRHRNVCGVHEYGEDGRLRYIAMEYVEGTDLKQELRRRGRIPPEEAFDVAIQCAMGLQAIHDVGIIHRDLKTPNIMRDARAQVRLMDFGIAKDAATKGSTGAGGIVGTPDYMSPEQARGEKLDFRADLYSLGIVVFEIFTGNRPFSSDSPVAMIRMQIENDPPLDALIARGLPPSLRPVLKKVLSKRPDERFDSAEELAGAFKEAEASWRASDRPSDTRQASAGALALKPQPTPIRATPRPTPTPTPEPTHASEPSVSLAEAVLDLQARLPQIVARGDLTAADAEIAVARRRYGSQPGAAGLLDDLQRRVDGLRREREEEQRRREKTEALLNQGREAWGTGRLEEAQLAFHAALENQPGHSEATSLLASVQSALERQREEESHRQATAVAAVRIEALLVSGSLEEAAAALAAARLEHGDRDPLAALAQRLTDALRNVEVEQQGSRELAILRLKGEAETLAGQGRLEEAQRILHDALSLEPGRPDLQEALVRLGVQQARHAEERRALAAAKAAALADGLVDSGKLAAARIELVRAGRELGSHESLAAVEARLRLQEEEAWRQREAKERADAPRRGGEGHQAREQQKKSERLARQRKGDEQLRGKESRKQEPAQKQISARLPVSSPLVARPALGVWIAGVTALVLLAGVGFTLRALLGEPAEDPAPAEGEPTQPTNAASTVTASPELPMTASPEPSSVDAVVKSVREQPGPEPTTPLPSSEESRTATPTPATAAPPVAPTQTIPEPSPIEKTHASPPAVDAVAQAPASPPAELRPVAPAEGILQVVVRPWAEVSVDGVLIGVTPLNRITLREGARVILLVHPAFAPLERTVTVRPGELTKLIVDLTREGTRK